MTIKIIFITILALCFGIIFLIIAPPNDYILDIEPIAVSVHKPIKFEGPLKLNTKLSDAEILFRDIIAGPESIAIAPNGDLYTGVVNGNIYKIINDKLIKFATIGEHPLGMRFNSKGQLYVIEPFSGLYRIDPKGTVTKLLSLESTKIDGFGASKAFDDLGIDEGSGKDGGDVIYFSDVSTKYSLHEMLYIIAAPDTTGRLIKYDINANNLTIIGKDYLFPNGIELTDDKSAIILCEFTKNRIFKHYIRGPLIGKTEIFIDNLPGGPDNIRRSMSKDETYWIGLGIARDSNLLPEYFSEYPLIKKFAFRITYLIGMIIKDIGKLFNYKILIDFGHHYKNGDIINNYYYYNYPGMAIEVDSKGKIITALHSPDLKILSLSEVREVKNTDTERVLYLGSYINPYLGKLTINK